MNISTVAQNLRNTIAGKVKHQVELEYALTLATTGERMALAATLEYLKINIDELKRILADVEVCIGNFANIDIIPVSIEQDAEIKRLQAQVTEQSWRDNPDRMGGQFTQDEIDNANKW